MKSLGPTNAAGVDKSGNVRLFVINFIYYSQTSSISANTLPVPGFRGVVKITSAPDSRDIEVEGADELQLTAIMMKIAYAWISKVCKDENLDLYKYTFGDVREAFDLFA